MTVHRVVIVVGLVLALGVIDLLIVQKEALVAEGTPMLLEIAPRDPRSLIQGDYMELDYKIARDAERPAGWPADGHLVVTLDDRGVAALARRHDPTATLAEGEHLLRYRVRDGQVRVGSGAFFFEEGQGELFAEARYGELRVDASGDSVLIGVRDGGLRPLGRSELRGDPVSPRPGPAPSPAGTPPR